VPERFVLGASFELVERVRLDAELGWLRWSQYDSPLTRTQSELELELGPLGGALPDSLDGTNPNDPAFRDTLWPRIGLEWLLRPSSALEVPLRTGYHFEASRLDGSGVETRFVDPPRHTWSVGSGIHLRDLQPTLDGRLRLDVYAAWMWLVRSTFSSALGRDRAGGSLVSFGLSLGVDFDETEAVRP
jgi:long-subunit fatty acid transport protein